MRLNRVVEQKPRQFVDPPSMGCWGGLESRGRSVAAQPFEVLQRSRPRASQTRVHHLGASPNQHIDTPPPTSDGRENRGST